MKWLNHSESCASSVKVWRRSALDAQASSMVKLIRHEAIT
jgi:hypothetical protein